jgi:hypothetical protein
MKKEKKCKTVIDNFNTVCRKIFGRPGAKMLVEKWGLASTE